MAKPVQRLNRLFLLLLLMSGCTLEDVIDKGLECDEENQYISGGQCKPNTPEHCGSDNNSCLDRFGWIEAKCEKGKCLPLKCAPDTTLTNDNCEPLSSQCVDGHWYLRDCEANDIENCGAHNQKCEIENGNASCTRDGNCQLDTCHADFHKYDEHCEPDTAQNCGEHGVSCAVEHAFNECIGAACQFTCKKGFHRNGDSCEQDSLENCGEIGNACTITYGTPSCDSGKCVYQCDTGYHLKGTECEPDNNEHCGNTVCNVENANNLCENGKCTFNCIEHYHSNDNECEADSISNCGSHGNACHYEHGTAECNNGKCVLKDCDTNYHRYNDICEINSTSNCGKHGTVCSYEHGTGSCSTAGNCALKSCDDGYHQYGETCELDTTTNCGKHGTSCVSAQTCSNKACVCIGDEMVLNYNKTACIPKRCQNIPGVLDAITCYNYQCFPIKCETNFKLDPGKQTCESNVYESFSQCIPTCTTDADCHKLPGYSQIPCSTGKICKPLSDNDCDAGYRKYSLACVPRDNCCGNTCQNCAAFGMKCSGSNCV